jgi:hypothetical protein
VRKEPMVALSSYKEEYIAASSSVCQAIWLMSLIDELSDEKCDTMIVKIDNMSAINLAKNPITLRKSKHIYR